MLFLRAFFSKDKIFRRLKAFFRESDSDHDGFLTMLELTKNLRKYGYDGTDEEIRVGMYCGMHEKSNQIPPHLDVQHELHWDADSPCAGLVNLIKHYVVFNCMHISIHKYNILSRNFTKCLSFLLASTVLWISHCNSNWIVLCIVTFIQHHTLSVETIFCVVTRI